MEDSEQVAVEWVVPASASALSRTELERLGAELRPADRPFTPVPEEEEAYAEAAFEPLVVIACVMGLTFLARRILSLVKDVRQDGIIVDARTQPVRVAPHPSLDRGQILVITENGSQFLERSGDAGDLAALLAAVGGR